MRLQCQRRYYDKDNILREIEEQTHTASLKFHLSLNSWWVQLSPGVTGYESVSVNDLLHSREYGKGWFAIAGTSGKYPELYVLPDSMDRLRDYLALMQPLLEAVIKAKGIL